MGADVGALVLESEASRLGLDGREIEISPGRGTRPNPCAPTLMVRARPHRPAVTRYAAVYPDLPAGAYTIWADEQRPAGRVVITGGRVANWSWPGA